LIVSPVLRLILIAIGFVLIVKAYYAPETKVEAAAGKVQRDFVTKEITPKYLSDLYDSHTSIQADALVKPLLGQWMRVSGSVLEVTKMAAGYPFVQIKNKDNVHLALSFSEKWSGKLSVLAKGHDITVVGRISSTGNSTIRLEDCELDEVTT
jgi:hypothetical protein